MTIERNYKTSAIADMKKIANENDAIVYVAVTAMSKIQYIDKIIKKNSDKLLIQYIPHQDNTLIEN
jgi:hypothetical protein